MRILLVAAAALAMFLVAVGCTTRPEASESLVMEGNHSKGDLAMVTADTSSEGYQYLEPEISPDGQRIVLTADWGAIPPPGHLPDPIPLNRQIALVPVETRLEPQLTIFDAGAVLVHFRPIRFRIGDSPVAIDPHELQQKGQPVWVDDDNILIWIETPRGARLFRCYVPSTLTSDQLVEPQIVFREPSDDEQFTDVPFWEHLSPAVSPDGGWVAFSRFGYADVDSLNSATGQSIWVAKMPVAGEISTTAFPVTSTASHVDGPHWSPDGRRLVFQAAMDLVQETNDIFTKEIFTIDFDTTGLAANGAIETDRNLTRLTYSPPQEGSPIYVRNESAVFSPDGTKIIFVSDRRVPTLTYVDRNIWWIPEDGSLDPQLVFFTRYDDVDPMMTGGPGNEVLLSSSMGFPTEMLDRLWREKYDFLLSTPQPDGTYLNEVQAESIANGEREELEFFEGVMSHLYLLTNW
jgi:dipeptidyl aminopeptidase/acylaminoacyl peptidase